MKMINSIEQQWPCTNWKDALNQQNKNKCTPLHHAALLNLHRTIDWMCHQGADVDLKDEDGERPYDFSDGEETKKIIQKYRK